MGQEIQIDIASLKEITDRIFEHLLNEQQIKVVEVTPREDHYWGISSDDRHRIEQSPPEMHVGRLSDDWEFLMPLLADRHQAFPLMLIHLAPILQFIGRKSQLRRQEALMKNKPNVSVLIYGDSLDPLTLSATTPAVREMYT